MPDFIKNSIRVTNLNDLANVTLQTEPADGSNTDAFGRLRISQPYSLFSYQSQYDIGSVLWENSTTGTASVTHLPNESSASLSVGTSNGDKVIRQTKPYFRYQPGKSHLILITAVINPAANVRKRLGYFDDNDGVFFEHNGSEMRVVIRSSVSGSPVETVIPQSNWNIDKMDGTGTSGITIDFSKIQIYFIDFQWLGAGRVRFGFDLNGILYYCHQNVAANLLSSVYMKTGNLPARLEIENTAASAGSSLKSICTAVASEGGYDLDGYTFAHGNGTTPVTVSTRRPIFSIKPSLLLNSIANRTTIIPQHYDILNGGNAPILFEIVYNGTLSGASFSSLSGTAVDYDTAANSISGGTVIDMGYLPASGNSNNKVTEAISHNLPRHVLTLNMAGNDSTILSIVATSTTGSHSVYGSILWKELR